ncbi:MAG: class I SAM-dependent methyltransferase [Actinobacteria bacterium]|nr:class I SAM-dependent methyltransferase [Actinomycetota bacterium]
MDAELARWLVSPQAEAALAEASSQPDPGSLAAATALRRHWPPDQAAAVLTQAVLRRRAVAKFGDRAAGLFLTPDGLEQATRADVARWRADRFRAAGARTVVDLGCGVGADALALLDAGLEVVAVEADPATAVLAQANLGDGATVRCADAVDVADELLGGGAAVFADPARRTAAGRTWRVADFSPPWEFVTGLLAGRTGCVKAAPGLPSGFIPDGVATTWVSHRGDLVEASLWSGAGEPGGRTAVLLPSGEQLDAGERRDTAVGPVGRYLHEPDPAVIRAGALATLAGLLDARCPQPGIAYLFSDGVAATPFATTFEVLEEHPFDEAGLRRWVREHGIGVLEIKVRGLDVDPAVLRRRLRPKGRAAATLVLTPTPSGSRALVVRRLIA